jgi:hypothetical protein
MSVIIPMKNFYESTIDKTSRGKALSAVSILPVTADANLNEIDFLQRLFRVLDEAQVRYCVLQRWDALLEELHTDHDVDLAVHPGDADRLPRVWRTLKQQGYQPIELLNHAVNSYAFIFCWSEGAALRTIMVDIAFEHRQGGLIWKSSEEFVKGREKQEVLWAADPGTELEYLLVKKMLKGTIKADRERRFELLVGRVGQVQAERIAGELFGQGRKREIVESCVNGGPGVLLRKLKRRFLWTRFIRNPFNLIRFVVSDAWRLGRRWFQPTGVFLALLGSDQILKDKIATLFFGRISPVFGSQKIYLRSRSKPNAKQDKSPATGSSGPNPGTFGSTLSYCVAMFRSWPEYALKIRPLLTRTNLVVLDQPSFSRKANGNGSRASASRQLRFLNRFFPEPELTFMLDTQPGNDPLPECVPSQSDFCGPNHVHEASLPGAGNPHVIHSDRGIEAAVHTAVELFVDYLAQRFQRRHGHWLGLEK